MIEVLNKSTNEITLKPIEQFLNELRKSATGKLNVLVDLCEGKIYQDLNCCWRLAGLEKYEWDWVKTDFTCDQTDLRILFSLTAKAYNTACFTEWEEQVRQGYRDYLKGRENPKTYSQWINGQIIALTSPF